MCQGFGYKLRKCGEFVAGNPCAFFAFMNLIMNFGTVGYATFWMSYFLLFSDEYRRLALAADPGLSDQYDPYFEETLAIPIYIFAFVLVCSVIALIFGMLLMIGIHKRIPNLIKSYFVYGIVVVVLCATSDVVYFGILATYGYFSYFPFLSVLTVLALYTGMLMKIRQFYINMKREKYLCYRIRQGLSNPSGKIFEE